MCLLNEGEINWTTWTYKTVKNYGNRGLCHHFSSVRDLNIENAEYEEIKEHFSRMGEVEPNRTMLDVVTKYFP